jgi:hypothetical protein
MLHRLGVSRLTSARTSAPAACFPLAGSCGAATSQRPRRLGLDPMARLRRGRRLGAADIPTWRRLWRSVGVGTAWGRLPPLTFMRPAWRPLRDLHPRDVDAGLRRALEDSIKTGRHSLGIVAVVVTIAAIILNGGFFFRLPLCLDFARRAPNAWLSRFFFFSFFFSKSFADFCFSANWRRLSRSTSSSFTGGLEDRASIGPCTSKDKLKEGSKKIRNRSHKREKNLPDRLIPHQAS